MFLVDMKKETIQECIVLDRKTGYTIIQVGNEILGLPAEDETHYLCETREQACQMLCGNTFVPQ